MSWAKFWVNAFFLMLIVAFSVIATFGPPIDHIPNWTAVACGLCAAVAWGIIDGLWNAK